MRVRYKHLKHLLNLCVLTALLVGSAVTVRPVYAASIVVNSSADTENLDKYCTLREAIIAANNDAFYKGCSAGSGTDTITFSPSLSGATITLGAELVINSSLIIDGSTLDSPVKISGVDAVRVFRIITDSTVTLDSLTISDGYTTSDGGGIELSDGSLTVANCLLINNHADYDGGGIYVIAKGEVEPIHLIVTGSTFIGNSADSGGAIYSHDNLTVISSTFSTNIAEQSGGGIFNMSGMSLMGSTFTINRAVKGDGGGLYNLGRADIKNSTFTANTTTDDGGGIYNASILTLTNCTLTGNSSSGLFGMGGAIYNQSTLTLTNCTLSGNSANNGGGIYNTTSGTLNYANTIIANSINGYDCSNDGGTIPTNVRNLVITGTCGVPYSTDDPKLGPLADNGGPTLTHALLIGSPAIDAGDLGVCPLTDQRGVPRPIGMGCDIGAFEYGFVIYLPLLMR